MLLLPGIALDDARLARYACAIVVQAGATRNAQPADRPVPL